MEANKQWIKDIQASLDLGIQAARKLPAGQRLEVQDLNKILEMYAEFKGTFLMQCELQGFKLESNGQWNKN